MGEYGRLSETYQISRQWQGEREHLNHTMLSNQVKMELSRLSHGHDIGQVPRLDQFLQQESRYRSLIAQASRALSAGVLIDTPWFDDCSIENREILREMFHQLYVAEMDLDTLLTDVSKALDMAVASVKNFVEMSAKERTVDKVTSLWKDVEALSLAISSLPKPFPVDVSSGRETEL